MRTMVLLLSLLCPPTLLAQESSLDTTITRLNWGTVDILVRPDTVHGLQLWVATSVHYHGPSHLFVASFDPGRVQSWLAPANLLTTTTARPSDGSTALVTPVLQAEDSSEVTLIREAGKHGWKNELSLVLHDRYHANAWAVRTSPSEARKLIQVLFTKSTQSRVDTSNAGIEDVNPFDTTGAPHTIGPFVLDPPPRLREKANGEIWLSFVVTTDGTTDSVHIILADDYHMARALAQDVLKARFEPARAAGKPIAKRVYQRFLFESRW